MGAEGPPAGLAGCPVPGVLPEELGPTVYQAGWHRAVGTLGVPGSETAGWDPVLQFVGGGGQEMGTPNPMPPWLQVPVSPWGT